MRRFRFFALSVGLGLVSACSLHSLDRLDSCRRAPDASECRGGASAAGTSAASGSEQGGSSSSGSGAGGGGNGSSSGSDSGGTSSTAGVAGSEAGEAGAGGALQLPRTLVALYADYSEGDDKNPDESTQVRAAFDIVNESPDDVPMSELTLRYYYTLEDASQQELDCDYPGTDRTPGSVRRSSSSSGRSRRWRPRTTSR